jgi:ribosomal-protein-alanine N-acetyltransferase
MQLDDLFEVRALARETGAELDVEEELARSWARIRVARVDAQRGVADEVHLLHLATRASARRRGIGRALLSELVEHGRCRQARLVLLEVRRSNHAARSLYESAGFRSVSTRRGYYADNREDALIMMLGLDSKTQEWLTQQLPPERI